MRLDNTARKFESNATLDSNAFKITASAKAFQVLSDQLYTDKPLAILRELGANAYDAHVANGNPDVPFDVHLPTRLNPELIIKDHGTGLSREQVFTLYTTYFDSDKTHTNELIGGLGLGSKSPFSYTDQFTVISRYAGEKVTYLAYIDDSGIPAITEISAEPFDEEDTTGLTITLPIKDSDHHQFERAAVKALSYIKTSPRINRDVDLTIRHSPASITMGDLTVRLRDSETEPDDYYMRQYLATGMRVIMGGVAYPVENNKFTDSHHRALTSKKIDVFAPIGWVDFTASREGLAYTKPTVKKLEDMLRNLDKELECQLQSQVQKASNLAEAVRIRNDFSSTLGIHNAEAHWNGFMVRGNLICPGRTAHNLSVRVLRAPMNQGKKKFMAESFGPGETIAWDTRSSLLWREKEGTYTWYVDDNPPERGKPILLFTGPKTAIDDFFKDTGLYPDKMPSKPKPQKGNSQRPKESYIAQYPAYIRLQLGAKHHRLHYYLSRADLTEALEYTDAVVYLEKPDELLCATLHQFDSRLKDKDLLFVDIPKHHSKVRDRLIKAGARTNIEVEFDALLPPDRRRLNSAIRTTYITQQLRQSDALGAVRSTLSDQCGSLDVTLPPDLTDLKDTIDRLDATTIEIGPASIPAHLWNTVITDPNVIAVRDSLLAWLKQLLDQVKTKYAPVSFGSYWRIGQEAKAAMFAAFTNQRHNEEKV
jgi:hypothetical protein